jgi:hypothetical protein
MDNYVPKENKELLSEIKENLLEICKNMYKKIETTNHKIFDFIEHNSEKIIKMINLQKENEHFEVYNFHADFYQIKVNKFMSHFPFLHVRQMFSQKALECHKYFNVEEMKLNIGKRLQNDESGSKSFILTKWMNIMNITDNKEVFFSLEKIIKIENSHISLEFFFKNFKSNEGMNISLKFMNKEEIEFSMSNNTSNSNNISRYSFYLRDRNFSCFTQREDNEFIEKLKHMIYFSYNHKEKLKTKEEYHRENINKFNGSAFSGKWFEYTEGSPESCGYKYMTYSNNKKAYHETWSKIEDQANHIRENKIQKEIIKENGDKHINYSGFRQENDMMIWEFSDDTKYFEDSGEEIINKVGFDQNQIWNSKINSNLRTNINLVENFGFNKLNLEEWYEKWYESRKEKFSYKRGSNTEKKWEEEWNEKTIQEESYCEKKCFKKCFMLKDNYEWLERWDEKFKNGIQIENNSYKMNCDHNFNYKYENYWGDKLVNKNKGEWFKYVSIVDTRNNINNHWEGYYFKDVN